MCADPAYKLKTFYGCLQHLFVVNLPQEPQAGLECPTTVILASITICKINVIHKVLDIHYYIKESSMESIIDVTCV